MTQPLSPVTADPLALAEHHEKECNRYVNGTCMTLRCMKRGGYVPGVTADFEKATCEAHETALLLRRHAQRQKPTCDELVTEIRKIRRQLGGFDYASCEVDLAKLLLAGILAPAQEARVPKVRTSHHRNKEEAARLQELVDKRYAPAQSPLERIPQDDNTRLATIAECAKVADDHSRSNKTAANNMFEAGGQKSAILFMESARTCDEIAAKLRALSVTSTDRVGSLFPDIGEQEPETILDSGECDCYVW